MKCDCKLKQLGHIVTEIDYCPLHKSAPDLYEACLAWGELWDIRPLDSGTDMQNILKRCWAKTQTAIAKVDGKETKPSPWGLTREEAELAAEGK